METKIILNTLPEDDEIGVRHLGVTYCQQQDNAVRSDQLDDQTIAFETVDADLGDYYYIIKTDRWAFCDIDEIITLFNDFKKRLEVNNKKEEKA